MQVEQHPADEHALRREGEEQVTVELEAAARLEHRPEPIARGPDRERRLVHDQRSGLESVGDLAGRRIDRTEIDLTALIDRHGHDHHHDLGPAHASRVVRRGSQPTAAHEVRDALGERRLVVVR